MLDRITEDDLRRAFAIGFLCSREGFNGETTAGGAPEEILHYSVQASLHEAVKSYLAQPEVQDLAGLMEDYILSSAVGNQFRMCKSPNVEVWAFQIDTWDTDLWPEWANPRHNMEIVEREMQKQGMYLDCETLGEIELEKGDWLVKGWSGGVVHYCDEAFRATFEEVG